MRKYSEIWKVRQLRYDVPYSIERAEVKEYDNFIGRDDVS